MLKEIQSNHSKREVVLDIPSCHKILCDQQKIERVISNLIGNAFRHGLPDQPIRIEIRITEDIFYFQIENGSSALSPAVLENIFEPFVQGENKKDGGLGLGLYISRQIISAHGGSIKVENPNGKIIFSFLIPTC